MSLVLGLDVSTSIVGVCVVQTQDRPVKNGIVALEHIDFKGSEDLFDKANVVEERLRDLSMRFGALDVVIEEPLMSFSKGMSSAKTITMLMRFNGMVSLLVKNVLGSRPSYISASHARKVCGVKMQRFKLCGLSQKEQTFNAMRDRDLKDVQWPFKKKTKKTEHKPDEFVIWAYDETDAYVLAAAHCIENLKIR